MEFGLIRATKLWNGSDKGWGSYSGTVVSMKKLELHNEMRYFN